MPDYVVIGRDGTDENAPSRRQGAREEHLRGARIAFEAGEWLDAAAMLDGDGAMVGSVILCRFPSREALDRWLESEAYVRGGVWKSLDVVEVRIPPPFAKLHALRRMDLTFRQRTDEFAVCRLAPDSELPEWLDRSGWYSLTRTDHELSIVCCADRVPESVKAERGWVMLEVQGPIPFETTGVLGRIASLLSAAEISLFVISTYDSDSVLVKRENLESTLRVFAAAGATLR